MARKRLHSKHKNRAFNSRNRQSPQSRRKRSRVANPSDQRLRAFEALRLWREGKAKTVSAAARAAGTTLKAMWKLVPRAIGKDSRTGRLRIKATDPYSEKVEILTDAGALVVTARGSRQRQLAGQHRATYMDVVRNKKPASALEQFRGKKVGGRELLSDYERLKTLAKAGVLGQLDALYVSAGGGR